MKNQSPEKNMNQAYGKGVEVTYKHFHGYVKFVCDDYVTICIQRGERKVNDVCLLVYKNDWDKIELNKSSHK